MAMKEMVQDLLRYFPARLVPAVVGFVSIPVLTNLFPPDDYGDYRLVLAAVSLLGPFVGWLSYAILRFYPEYEKKDELGGFYATVLKLSVVSELAFAALWGLALILTRGVVRPSLHRLLVVGLGLMIVNSTFSTVASLVRSRREATWFSVSASTRSILNIALGLLFILVFGMGISGFLLGMALGGALIVPLLWWRARHGMRITWRAPLDLALSASLFRYSYPIVLGFAAAWLLQLSDRYILEFFRGSGEVGIYAASYGLAETSVGMIVSLFHLPFVVLANRVFETEGERAAAAFVSDSARLYLLVAIPAVVGISVLARPLVQVMTGAAYIQGYRIVPFVSLATVLSGLAFWYRTAFMFKKRNELGLVAVAAGAFINIGLNLLLIPRFGYIAAGITTLVGYLALNGLSYLLSRRIFYWKLPVKSMAKALLASTLMGVVVWLFDHYSTFSGALTLVLGIPLGIAVVVIALMAMREFSQAELAKFRRFFRSRETVERHDSE